MNQAPTLLKVHKLCKFFAVRRQGFFNPVVGSIRAVDQVSFDLHSGETLALVGESGCGKTTTARTILRALTPTAGKVLFRRGQDNIDLVTLAGKELKAIRPHLQMIFQDPFSSLNPRMTVRDIIGEPLQIHGMGSRREITARVAEMLQRVGLKPEHGLQYPHAFSGGQRQRIGIARALIMRPALVVADEAVSALDVSVQAQIINLLQELQEEYRLSYLFIAHDLNVVRHISDRVAVMYAGRIVELAETGELFDNPLHPYTRALLAAIPHVDPRIKMHFETQADRGEWDPSAHGCAFRPRCPRATEACAQRVPELIEISPAHFCACHCG